jgi:hypothetical protein
MKPSNQINRQKASSHPFNGSGVFVGQVKSVVNGLPVVFVKQLNCTFNNVNFVGNTVTNTLKTNDKVLCTFIDNQTQEIYVLGAFNQKKDKYVTVAKFNALIDQIETLLELPSNALDAYKQTEA